MVANVLPAVASTGKAYVQTTAEEWLEYARQPGAFRTGGEPLKSNEIHMGLKLLNEEGASLQPLWFATAMDGWRAGSG